MVWLAWAACVVGAPAPSIAYVLRCDPLVCDHAQWALDQWQQLVVPPARHVPIAVTVDVAKLPPKRILGTFTGCTPERVCSILVSPKAVPDLVRATLLHELGHVYGIRCAAAAPPHRRVPWGCASGIGAPPPARDPWGCR